MTMCMTKGLFRLALIGGLAAGGATILLGPERIAAGFAQLRSHAQGAVDRLVDDPVALRRQLQSLSEQYPKKIATIRGELAEVDRQVTQLEHDREVAYRVVANTTSDMDVLKELMARAGEASSNGRPVVVVFDARRLDATDAQREFRRISRIRAEYQERVETTQHHLGYLTQQRTRLGSMLEKLETEFTTFEQQMYALDRKIDAIARNERLVEMIKERESALAGFDTHYKSATLNQLEGKLAEWQARVDAEFEALERRNFGKDYEEAARWELDADKFEEPAPVEVKPMRLDDRAERTLEQMEEALVLGSTAIRNHRR